VTGDLSSSTSSTRTTIVLDKGTDFRPSVVSSNELKSLVLTEVSREYVVVLAAQYAESEVINVRDINPVIQTKEARFVDRPSRVCAIGGEL
jgi:hypothetical protein